MFKATIASAILLLAFTAKADIPMPPHGRQKEEITTSSISGAAAESLYESINSQAKVEASLRTSSTMYKVLRSKDGMDQVICKKTAGSLGRKKVSFECETQSSNTDEELPVYKPAIRMG